MKRPSKVSQDMLWEELKISQMTAVECAKYLGIVKRNANMHLAALKDRREPRQRLRIADWQQSKYGHPAPVYAVGFGPDAIKPTPLTACQTTKRHREKYRALIQVKRKGIISPWAGLLIKPATKTGGRQHDNG